MILFSFLTWQPPYFYDHHWWRYCSFELGYFSSFFVPDCLYFYINFQTIFGLFLLIRLSLILGSQSHPLIPYPRQFQSWNCNWISQVSHLGSDSIPSELQA